MRIRNQKSTGKLGFDLVYFVIFYVKYQCISLMILSYSKENEYQEFKNFKLVSFL